MLMLLLTLALQSAPVVQAPSAPTPPKAEEIPANFRFVVNPPGITHLGSLGPKEVKTTSWDVINRSDKPLAFRVLDLSPGVTVEGDPFQAPLAPGEHRKVTARVDPTGFLGYQRRGVRIEPVDPSQPRYKLLLDMTVRPELAVDGTLKNLGDVTLHESPQISYRFTREGGDPVAVKLASPLPDYLEAEILPQGESAELRLTLRSSKIPLGRMAGLEVMKVSTNAPMQPEFTLYMNWNVVLPVEADPPRVVFTDLKTKVIRVELKGRDRLPFRILNAELEGSGYALGPVPTGLSGVHQLDVRRVSDVAADAVLVIHCSNSDDPLRLPVRFSDPRIRKPAPSAAPAEAAHGH